MANWDFSQIDIANFILFSVGISCALWLRRMRTGPIRGWTKLAAFATIGTSIFLYGITYFHDESTKSITPLTVTGTLVNLHTVIGSYRSSPVLHFDIDAGSQTRLLDLHGGDGLFFMKAENGEQVQATFTKETGYVSHLQILDGPHAGFQFDEPDVPNTTPGILCMLLGFASVAVGIFKWVVDQNADPALTG